MLKGTFTIILITAVLACCGQDNNDSATASKNTFYLELLGNGLWGSVNYDRIFINRENYMLSLSVGGIFFPIHYSIPVSFNLMLTNSKYLREPHHIELGAGITYVYDQGIYGDYGVDDDYSSILHATLRVGYRYQKEYGGFFFKTGVIPFFPVEQFNKNLPVEVKDWGDLNPFVSFGLGVGYTFIKKRK